MLARKLVAALLALCLAACGDAPSAMHSASATGGEFRLERYCSAPGLKPSLRHTFLLIDQSALAQAASATEFAERNGIIRDAVLAFGDPVGALQSGALDYRERLSLFVLPHDGSAARLLFEGCVPGLSPEELAESRQAGSAIGDFFTGGAQQTLENERDTFRARLVSAVVLAARDAAAETRPLTGPLPASKLIASLTASGHLINGEKGVPRVVLLANLAGMDLGGAATREAARTKGFADGAELGLDLGRSEMHVLLIDGTGAALAREYADAFFLAQNARLLSWSGRAPAALPAAPVEVQRFAGDAAYPSGPETIQIRVGADRNGNLVNSWLVLRGRPDRAIPLTGQQTCAQPEDCTLRGDEGGFAQTWTLAPGGEPDFANELPFGGVRDWEMRIEQGRVSGRAFDPAVRIGDSDSIAISARAAEGATF